MSIRLEAEGDLDHTHLTNHTRTDQFQEFRCLRMATIHIRFHQEDTMALRRLDDGHGLGMIERNGLLTEHMFSRLSGFDGPFSMERMRKSQIDCLHALVSQHILVTAVAMGNTPALTKCVGGSLGAAPNGNERSRLRLLHPIGKDTSNQSSPNDAPGKCSTHASLFFSFSSREIEITLLCNAHLCS